MKYGSICSGIEAATVAWHPLNWRPAWFAEIDKFPSAVLKHHYSNVPNHGDFTRITRDNAEPIELLVGGTPCQAFSVAGLRKGLDDERGNLTLEFLRLADRFRPRWIVWENVPGVLSIDGGRTFGTFLGGLGECGYGFAYRVLDAQYFRVPQRRRRVFVVGCLGDWRSAAAVLFERESVQGYPAPRREAGEATANCLRGRANSSHRADSDNFVANCLNAKGGTGRIGAESETFIAHALRGEGFDASEDGTGRGIPLVPIGFYANDNGRDACMDGFPTLRSMDGGGGNHPAVAFNLRGREDGSQAEISDLASIRAASGGSSRSYVAHSGVRRLTPRECERLQGFPDDYTLIPYRGKPAADGPRYKALGNSMAVPVMRWIGERIQAVDAILRLQESGVA